MKKKNYSIFRRISLLIFSLITILSILFIITTYFSTTHFYESTTQLLNKDVAAHIATFTSPFEKEGLNKKVADSIFYNAMVLSPSIEVYFLDTLGKVIYYHAPDSTIKLWQLPLRNIVEHIQKGGVDYIKGPDPKNPEVRKIFSAAEVYRNSKKVGYIYVVLGGNQYQNASQILFESHILTLAIQIFCIVLIVSVIISFLYINRLKKHFNKITDVLDEFLKGNYKARFDTTEYNEFTLITNSFNRMADLLVYNIDRLQKSERERRDFIASISHDLRTPLSVARGYTETLLNGTDNQQADAEKQNDFIQIISKKIQQVELMVKQLSELSKMEFADFRPIKEPFIFSEILHEAVNTHRKVAKEKNIALECSGCEDISWINADIRMMERVIQNLIDNSIKYTDENGRIHISLKREDGNLIADFENTGSPFPKELIQWINKNGNESAEEYRPVNLGLGLAIVKKILCLHDYTLQAKTNSGSYNQFSIRMKIHS